MFRFGKDGAESLRSDWWSLARPVVRTKALFVCLGTPIFDHIVLRLTAEERDPKSLLFFVLSVGKLRQAPPRDLRITQFSAWQIGFPQESTYSLLTHKHNGF